MPIHTTANLGVICLTGTRDAGETDHHKTLNGTRTVSVLAEEITAVIAYPVFPETDIYELGVERRSCGTVAVPVNGSEQNEAVAQLTAAWVEELKRIAEADE